MTHLRGLFAYTPLLCMASAALAQDLAGQAPPVSGATRADRVAAATATAKANPACSAGLLGPFYWEIGNKSGRLASGSLGHRSASEKVTAATEINIASASKWLYAAYVVEKHGDAESNRPSLTLTSGYSNFRSTLCPAEGTVSDCHAGAVNIAEARDRIFHYDGGHLQKNAQALGLGSLVNATLPAEIESGIGSDIALSYVQPVLAGGAAVSASQYAIFLRKLLKDSAQPLRLGSLLGSHAVCTYPSASCVASELTAVPEAWHYSLGHWVEDDPNTTPSLNFAYSSPGSFGFYPWIGMTRALYGIVARENQAYTAGDQAYLSIQCGRMIRLAWVTGVAQ